MFALPVHRVEITLNYLQIPIYLRTNQHFRPPDDLSKPLIMIGPGTGVAPFLGFLQHRAFRKCQLRDDQCYGVTWLFYGCRNKNKDYLFRYEVVKQQHIQSYIAFFWFSRCEQETEGTKEQR